MSDPTGPYHAPDTELRRPPPAAPPIRFPAGGSTEPGPDHSPEGHPNGWDGQSEIPKAAPPPSTNHADQVTAGILGLIDELISAHQRLADQIPTAHREGTQVDYMQNRLAALRDLIAKHE